MDNEVRKFTKYNLLPTIKVVFFRLTALAILFYAIKYWLLVVGFHGDGAMRFDTMEIHWRIASSSLSVLLPIVALGLWGMYPWGVAIWLIAVLIEVTMYVAYHELFGSNEFLLLFHLLCLGIYLVISIFEKAKKSGPRETA